MAWKPLLAGDPIRPMLRDGVPQIVDDPCDCTCEGVECPEDPEFEADYSIAYGESCDLETFTATLCDTTVPPEGWEVCGLLWIIGDGDEAECDYISKDEDGSCVEIVWPITTPCCVVRLVVTICNIEMPSCTAIAEVVKTIKICENAYDDACEDIECSDQDLPASVTITLTGDVTNNPNTCDPDCFDHSSECENVMAVTVDRVPGTCSYLLQTTFTDDLGCRTGIFGCAGPGSVWQYYDSYLQVTLEFTSACTFVGSFLFREDSVPNDWPCGIGAIAVGFVGCVRGGAFVVTGITDSSDLSSACGYICGGTAITGVSVAA